MRHTAFFVAILLLVLGMSSARAEGGDCVKETLCSHIAPAVVPYKGTKFPKDTIEVTVCHPSWDKLVVGTLPDGRKSKGWGPTLVDLNGSESNLVVATEECKLFTRSKGQVIQSLDCGDRIITTGKMLKSGTYYMK